MTVTADEMIIATCLKAGKIMVENGSEISRVNDTMMRIAQNAGVVAANTYVTITGVMMSIQGRNATQIAAVNQRTIDLEKVAQVNQLSREFGQWPVDDHVSPRNCQYLANRCDWNGGILSLLLAESVFENQISE